MLFKIKFFIYFMLMTSLTDFVLAQPLSRNADKQPSALEIKAIAKTVDKMIILFERTPDFKIVSYSKQEQKYLDAVNLTEEEICILFLKHREKKSFTEVLSYPALTIIKDAGSQMTLQFAFVFNQFTAIFKRRPHSLKSKIGKYTKEQQAFMYKWYSLGSESYFNRKYSQYRQNQLFIDNLLDYSKRTLFKELLDQQRKLDKAKNTAKILNEFAMLLKRGLSSEDRRGFNAAEEAFYTKHKITSEVQLRRLYVKLLDDETLIDLKIITNENLEILAQPWVRTELTARERKQIEKVRINELKQNDIVAYMQELAQSIYEKELVKSEKVKLNTGFGMFTAVILELRQEIDGLKGVLNNEINHYLKQGNHHKSNIEKFAGKVKEFSVASTYFKELLDQFAQYNIIPNEFDCIQSVMKIN